ncbi:unnamed protein product [Brassica rapa subsp. trilocularis]
MMKSTTLSYPELLLFFLLSILLLFFLDLVRPFLYPFLSSYYFHLLGFSVMSSFYIS